MAYLTLERLIDDDGEVDRIALRHMVVRRAINDHGGTSPRALRAARRHYRDIIPALLHHHRITKGHQHAER